jgi:hypothetical protein
MDASKCSHRASPDLVLLCDHDRSPARKTKTTQTSGTDMDVEDKHLSTILRSAFLLYTQQTSGLHFPSQTYGGHFAWLLESRAIMRQMECCPYSANRTLSSTAIAC